MAIASRDTFPNLEISGDRMRLCARMLDLSPTERLVLQEIAWHRPGTDYAKDKDIAAALEVTIRTVVAHRHAIRDKGRLSWKRGRYGSIYEIHYWPDVQNPCISENAPDVQGFLLSETDGQMCRDSARQICRDSAQQTVEPEGIGNVNGVRTRTTDQRQRLAPRNGSPSTAVLGKQDGLDRCAYPYCDGGVDCPQCARTRR